MDWKMILIGLAMIGAGSFLAWRLRRTSFFVQAGPGCIMAFALLLVLTGLLTGLVGIVFRAG